MLNSRDIVSYLKLAYEKDWITSRDGNISCRFGNSIAISNSGTIKHSMDTSEISVFNIKDNQYPEKASIETKLHHLIHLESNGVSAVVHVHPIYCIASARYFGSKLQEKIKEFPEIHRYTKVGETVPYIEPGDHALAETTAKNIKNSDIVILESHGVVAKGSTVEEAFQHIERLEHVCKILMVSKR